jgi:hypothetical protein
MSGTSHYLIGINFIDAITGTAVGGYGTILRTTNGGITWTLQTSGTGRDLRSVSLTDANTGTAVGDYGTILRTTNGGINWTIQTSGTTNTLKAISFSDANNGTAVGSGGTILHTTNCGVTYIEEHQLDEIPTRFSLSNNWPNPFNPSTKISWQSPVGSWQTLKIYDVLGNEVVTLVNEYKPAGSYEVEFNASPLPSGVYFYQLRIGNPSAGSGQSFVETKKMILMK